MLKQSFIAHLSFLFVLSIGSLTMTPAVSFAEDAVTPPPLSPFGAYKEQGAWQQFISDLQAGTLKRIDGNGDTYTTQITTLSDRLGVLQWLGLLGSNSYGSKSDGRPVVDPAAAFYAYVNGLSTENANCVTAHAVVLPKVAEAMGLEAGFLVGPWNQGDGPEYHVALLVRDKASKNFYFVNWYLEPVLIPHDTKLDDGANWARAVVLAQEQHMGKSISVAFNERAQLLTHLGALFNDKIASHDKGIETQKLADGSYLFVTRVGNFIAARTSAPTAGNLTYAGYTTGSKKIGLDIGYGLMDGGTTPSEGALLIRQRTCGSTTLPGNLNLSGYMNILAKLAPEAVAIPSELSSKSEVFNEFGGTLQHSSGVRADVHGQWNLSGRQTADLGKSNISLRSAASYEQKISPFKPVVLRYRVGEIIGADMPGGRTVVSTAGTAEVEYQSGKLSLLGELNFLSKGQGTISSGTGYALTARYGFSRHSSGYARLVGGRGPKGNPFDLGNYIRPATTGTRVELGFSVKFSSKKSNHNSNSIKGTSGKGAGLDPGTFLHAPIRNK